MNTSRRGNAGENLVARVLRHDLENLAPLAAVRVESLIEALPGPLAGHPWIVGSMRQSAGGGDLICSRELAWLEEWFEDGMDEPQITEQRVAGMSELVLVEVKREARPFNNFRPDVRRAMIEVGKRAGAARLWLAHVKAPNEIAWIPSEGWPR